MTDVAIRAEGLSKRFWLHPERRTGLKERFIRGGAPAPREFWALRDASFEIPKGSTFGLLGHNGSGKSTTLKVLAGIYRPTSGAVEVNGRVSALLELGAGFHPELTGRENVRLNGSILGLSNREIEAKMDGIIDFAGIGEFIDAPVKVYSSGMYVRLGFAVAVSLDPEVLMVDEIIAVGDEEFQRKCFDYLFDLRRRGSTIVIVSHSLGILRDLCDQAAWLDHGRIQSIGAANTVVDDYLHSVNARELDAAGVPSETASPATSNKQSPTRRMGSGEIRVTGIDYLDANGTVSGMLVSGQPCTFRMHFEAHAAIENAVFGIGFVNETGINVAGPNSGRRGGCPVRPGIGFVDFGVPELTLQATTYLVSAAVVDRGHTYDYVDREYELKVRGGGDDEPGVSRMPGVWRLDGIPEPTSKQHREDHVGAQ